jgi:hypothetical protein
MITTSFELKPMDRRFWVITVVYGALVVGLGVGAFFQRALAVPALLLALIGLAVWGWFRPRALGAGPESLEVVWPWRRRMILRGQILRARRLDLRELWPLVRVGVGGLAGVYGWFWRPGHGWLEIYVSARQDLVFLEMQKGPPLSSLSQGPGGIFGAPWLD